MKDGDFKIHVSDLLVPKNDTLLSEFGAALCYSAIQEPLLGGSQLVDQTARTNWAGRVQFMEAPSPAAFGSPTWHAQVVGSALGKLVPLMAVAVCVKGVSSKLSSETLLSQRSSIGLSIREAACTGFVADSLLKPTTGAEDWIYERTKNGTIGAITFSAMTAGSLGLDHLAKSRAVNRIGAGSFLTNPMVSGIVGGLPGGLVAAELESLKAHNRFATAQELGQSVYSTAVIGGVLGPVNHHGGKAVASLLETRARIGNNEVPAVLRRITSSEQWPQLRADQQNIVASAIETTSAQLRQNGHDAASFFARGFDFQAFLRARNHLNRHASAQDGISGPALDHHSAALIATFGKDWKNWLDKMESLGIERTEAAGALPLRPAEQQAGLAQLLLDAATPARLSGRNLDASDVVSLVSTIGSRWSAVKPEHLSLPIDDLAFRLAEGTSKSEFLPQRESLSRIRLVNSSSDATGIVSGELIVSTANTANVASLCFRSEGNRTQVSLLGVEPAYRRLGFGKMLLSELGTLVRPRSNEITLSVATQNTPAVSLYMGLGFAPDTRTSGNPSVLNLSKPNDL